jgi:hypothetical protein
LNSKSQSIKHSLIPAFLFLASTRRYETIWLPVLAKALTQGKADALLPPIDVLFISYVHRIAPQAYYKDTSLLKTRASAAGVAVVMPSLPPWKMEMDLGLEKEHREQVGGEVIFFKKCLTNTPEAPCVGLCMQCLISPCLPVSSRKRCPLSSLLAVCC